MIAPCISILQNYWKARVILWIGVDMWTYVNFDTTNSISNNDTCLIYILKVTCGNVTNISFTKCVSEFIPYFQMSTPACWMWIDAVLLAICRCKRFYFPGYVHHGIGEYLFYSWYSDSDFRYEYWIIILTDMLRSC